MKHEYLVVGTGLMGASIARTLADAGHTVLAVERRAHFGGNVHDSLHDSGIRMHDHGPHYFRTGSASLWAFVRRFASFYPYEARILSRIDGELQGWPVTASYLRQSGIRVDDVTPQAKPRNFESAMLARMPRAIFERFVKDYTEKQWGVPVHTLDERLAARIPIRYDDDPRLTPRARYQGLPTNGYTAMVSAMLAGIPVELGVDYLVHRDYLRPSALTVFTGPIDEYFCFSLGRLKYRAQRRTTTYHADVDWYQPAGQVNEPQHSGGTRIRTLEWKHMMQPAELARVAGTLITCETPFTPENTDDYEYPFPDKANRALYRRYRELANRSADTLICGRLGEYRYYDMDQAIARARVLAGRILQHGPASTRTA
jgi:UDP-galactopyranose mutase